MKGYVSPIGAMNFGSLTQVARELGRVKIAPAHYSRLLIDAYLASPTKARMVSRGLLANAKDFTERNQLLTATRLSENAGLRLEVVKAFRQSKRQMELITGLSLMTTKDATHFFRDYFEVGGTTREVTDWLAGMAELYVSKKKEHQVNPEYDGFWSDAWDVVVGAGKTIGEAISSVIDALNNLKITLVEVIDNILSYSQRTINNMIEALVGIGKEVAEIIKATIEAIRGSMEEALQKIFKGILAAGKTVYDIIKALYEEITGYISLGITTLVKIGRRIKHILAAAAELSLDILKDVIGILVDLGKSVWYILNWARKFSEELLTAVFEKLLAIGKTLGDLVAWCVRRSFDIMVKGFKILLALGYAVGVIVVTLITDPDNTYSKGLNALMELGGTVYDFFEAAADLGTDFVQRVYLSLQELGLELVDILKLAAEKGYEAFKQVVLWLIEVGVKILGELIFAAGFAYDSEQQIFYSRLDPWQQNLGYFTLYDLTAPLLAMIIHCEPIRFEYDDRSWKIEFWKGQYGICTGAEIGIYTGEFQVNTGIGAIDHTINQINFGGDTQCASGDDMLAMSFTLKKGNDLIFTRHSDDPATVGVVEKHWWLTGFKPMEFSSPSDLRMDINIVLKDSAMRDAFVGGLEQAGYTRDTDFSFEETGTTVNVIFDTPHTEQPYPW